MQEDYDDIFQTGEFQLSKERPPQSDIKLDEHAHVPLPSENNYPLEPVYGIPGRAVVYALKSGFRVALMNIPRLHRCNYQRRKFKWRILQNRFSTFQAAYNCCHAWDEDFEKHHPYARKHTIQVTNEQGEVFRERLDMEIHHKAHYREYWRDRASGVYPGDWNSDNVWWYNKGFIDACTHRCRSVPSWCLGAAD